MPNFYIPLQYPNLQPKTFMQTFTENVEPLQQIQAREQEKQMRAQEMGFAKNREQRAYAQEERAVAQEGRSAAQHDLQMRMDTLNVEDKERFATDMKAVRDAGKQGGDPFERLYNSYNAAADQGNLQLAETFKASAMAIADAHPDPAVAAQLKTKILGITFTPEQILASRMKTSATENVATTIDPTTGKVTQQILPWGQKQLDLRNQAARAGSGGGGSGFTPRAALGLLNTQQQMLARSIDAIKGQIAAVDAQLDPLSAIPVSEAQGLFLKKRRAELEQQAAQAAAQMLAVGQQAQSLLYSGNTGAQQTAAPVDSFEAGLARFLGEGGEQESPSTWGQLMEGARNIGPLLSALSSRAYALVPPPPVPPEKAFPSIYRPNLLTPPPRTPIGNR